MKLRTILMAAGGPLVLAMILRSWAGDASSAAGSQPVVAPRLVRALPVVAGRDRAVDGVRAELAELRADVSRLGSAAAPADELSAEEQRARDDRRVAAQAALLEKTFAADGRDPSWSPQAERLVRDAFAAAAAALPGARLVEAACGATLCRVVVAFDSIEHRDEGFHTVVELARWPSLGFGDVSPDDPLRYVFYASRDQDSFPVVE